jgi:SAM-dependent methyltransferase
MCRQWRQSLPPGEAIEDYTFIDLGAGMGRALLLASELPFRRVIGVEVNSSLIPIARRNIDRWSANRGSLCPVEILEEDARNFTLPPGPLLIFLYNPFGEEIVEEVILQMLRHEQLVDVLYIFPIFGWLFERYPAFRRSWMKLIPMDSFDITADAFHGTNETCAAYRKDYVQS